MFGVGDIALGCGVDVGVAVVVGVNVVPVLVVLSSLSLLLFAAAVAVVPKEIPPTSGSRRRLSPLPVPRQTLFPFLHLIFVVFFQANDRQSRAVAKGILTVLSPPPNPLPCRAFSFVLPQSVTLALKPHVVIATPGRLVDHLENTKGFSLRTAKYLVLDEADRMLGMVRIA